jgi:hypothetical protein
MSKASHGINLSEDVFAGFNATIRGDYYYHNFFKCIHSYSFTCYMFTNKEIYIYICLYVYICIYISVIVSNEEPHEHSYIYA